MAAGFSDDGSKDEVQDTLSVLDKAEALLWVALEGRTNEHTPRRKMYAHSKETSNKRVT